MLSAVAKLAVSLLGAAAVLKAGSSGGATTAASAMALVRPRTAATITSTTATSSQSSSSPVPNDSTSTSRPSATTDHTLTNTTGIPKSTIALAVGIGAPFLLIIMGSIMIWGYVIGRRDNRGGNEFKYQRRKTEQATERRRSGRATFELEGREVQEMGGCAVAAAELSGERPPVEMPQEREPAELPLTVGTVPSTSRWVVVKPETMRF